MKRFFLIPLMTMLCVVMAWGATITVGTSGDYSKLEDAFTNAVDGDEIQLISDITLSAASITNAKTLTLNLNGFTINSNKRIIQTTEGKTLTITGNGTFGSTQAHLIYVNGGNVVLECGTIQYKYKSASGASVVIVQAGNFTMNGGTLKNIPYNASTPNTETIWGIRAQGTGTVVVNGGTINVTTTGDAASDKVAKGILSTSTGSITINGGTITARDYAVQVEKGSLSISGDAVLGDADCRFGVYAKGVPMTMTSGSIVARNGLLCSGTATINGGTISSASTAINIYAGGTLNMNGGTVNCSGPWALQNSGSATITNGTLDGGMWGIMADGGSTTIVDGENVKIKGGSYGIQVGTEAGTADVTVDFRAGAITSSLKCFQVFGPTDSSKQAVLNISGGTFTVTPTNPNSNSTTGMDVQGNKESDDVNRDAYNAVVNISGGTFSGGYAGVSLWGKGAVANISGGSIDANAFGICGNGTSQYNGTEIYITGGNITGDGAGIYHPQAGTLNIKGNPVITGHTAIQLCAGVGLTGSITGGRFEAYGEDNRATKTGDGLIPDGAALSIVNRSYPGGMPQFTIKGGVFLAQHQDAILAYTWSDNTASEWAEAASHLSAREGIFSSDPSAYVPADGYTVTELDPTPEVYNHDAVEYANLWRVGETTHEQSYDFTEEQAEYVEINATTGNVSNNMEGTTYTLAEDQSSKKVEVAKDYTLIIKEDKKLNIGNGGLDLNAGSQVVVEPGAVVTVGVNGITSASGTDNLVLQANSEKQAALLIDPDVIQNTQPLATVILSTKAHQKSASPWNYIWEYFASPVAEITPSTKPTNNFDEAVHGLFAGETEFVTGVYTWGGNDWALVNSWTSLVPFKGYQLTNNSANGGVEYTFKGNLLGNTDGEYAFTSNGYGYFGNSYSAPIVISAFLSALDNTVYERTVWLYDAGADTYVSVNPLAARLGSAKYKDGTAIKEIRSLQAFILNKKAEGANAPINYRDAIWNNPRINSLVNAAPAREQANDIQWTNIYVEANGNKELVTLVEGEDFSDAFDNGADAGKYINNNSMNLYAATNDGEQAIVATDNLENTLISFQAGNATEYTLSFENGNEDYMLRDNVTGQTIAIIEGAEYSFEQAANTTVPARFEVIAAPKTATAIENVEEAVKATGIYTITGQYMGRDFTKLPAGVYVVNGVKIVK